MAAKIVKISNCYLIWSKICQLSEECGLVYENTYIYARIYLSGKNQGFMWFLWNFPNFQPWLSTSDGENFKFLLDFSWKWWGFGKERVNVSSHPFLNQHFFGWKKSNLLRIWLKLFAFWDLNLCYYWSKFKIAVLYGWKIANFSITAGLYVKMQYFTTTLTCLAKISILWNF